MWSGLLEGDLDDYDRLSVNILFGSMDGEYQL